jgi:uncharacterized protein with HEPN domain
MEKDPAIYVRHILEAIANIETDIAGYDFEKFRADRRTRQLVERNLEILSEASRIGRMTLADVDLRRLRTNSGQIQDKYPPQ